MGFNDYDNDHDDYKEVNEASYFISLGQIQICLFRRHKLPAAQLRLTENLYRPVNLYLFHI